MAKSSKASNRWKPDKIDKEKVRDLVRDARFHLQRIEHLVMLDSYFLEDHYGEAFEAMEELYNVLDLGNLVQDNQARMNKHMKKVREIHG